MSPLLSRLSHSKTMTSASILLAALALLPSTAFSFVSPIAHRPTTPTPLITLQSSVGQRIPIDESFPGAKRIHSSPDIFVLENFLDDDACEDIVARATAKGDMTQSPVAYAGWTSDLKDLTELAAKGPVAWLAIGGAWFQTKDDASASQIDLVVHMLQNFGVLLAIAIAGIAVFTKNRADSLQQLRTSTSTTLSTVEGGSGTFVRRAAALFGDGVETSKAAKRECRLFEAPTVIRYESDQVLAPHYDANRSAATEDANRGGQTLATLLVYLNDVPSGGNTRFGKLPAVTTVEGDPNDSKLTIKPKKGDALLFFPADANGVFDDRTEHEGCAAVDEKWIARIWRHEQRVPPPFGLSDNELDKLG